MKLLILAGNSAQAKQTGEESDDERYGASEGLFYPVGSTADITRSNFKDGTDHGFHKVQNLVNALDKEHDGVVDG